MKNADLPAMPFVETDAACSVVTGLTKREMFASMAMQGLTSVDNFSDDNETISRMAEWSVKCADALLAALDRKEVV